MGRTSWAETLIGVKIPIKDLLKEYPITPYCSCPENDKKHAFCSFCGANNHPETYTVFKPIEGFNRTPPKNTFIDEEDFFYNFIDFNQENLKFHGYKMFSFYQHHHQAENNIFFYFRQKSIDENDHINYCSIMDSFEDLTAEMNTMKIVFEPLGLWKNFGIHTIFCTC